MDNKEISKLAKQDVVRNIGIVAQQPFIFEGTLEDNLRYACEAAIEEENAIKAKESLPSLDDMINVLHQAGIFIDVLQFGLNTILRHEENQTLEASILSLRRKFHTEYGGRLMDWVELYDQDRYLYFTSVSGNIIFGSPLGSGFQNQDLSTNEFFLDFLKKTDLLIPLLELGRNLCQSAVPILDLLPPDDILFEKSPIQSHELEAYKSLSGKLESADLNRLTPAHQEKLLRLAFRFTPRKHTIADLSKSFEDRILGVRPLFRAEILKAHPEAIVFHRMDQLIYSQTIMNNIFFGKLQTETPQAHERIYESIVQLLIEEDLLEAIIQIGLQYQVGIRGEKLSGGQRQKLAIARVFLKNPRMVILDEATSALDNASQSRIQNFLDTRLKKKTTVVAVVHRLDIIKNYDKIAVMKSGKIGEIGTYSELMDRRGLLYELSGGKP